MAPKKKAADDGEDTSCEKFIIVYRKLCKAIEEPIYKKLDEEYRNEYLEGGNNLTKVSIYVLNYQFFVADPIGWQGVKAIMDALRAAEYQHAKIIRLCRTLCEDEGVRACCNYVAINPNVIMLDLMANNISPLGCEFVGKLMHPDMKRNIVNIKLDHNAFGSAGMDMLAAGLRMNKVVQNLSLTYCEIDEKGARSIFEILLF